MTIPVDDAGYGLYPLERGKWIAYPATDWTEQDDDPVSYFEDDQIGKLMTARVTALRAGDVETARDMEAQIEDLLNE